MPDPATKKIVLTNLSQHTAQTANKFNLSAAELKEIAKKLRRDVITMIATAGSGHPGGSLSAADIVASLYFKALRHDPENPQWQDRDRFGSACQLVDD